MYYFALPLLLGLLVIPVITDFPPGSCDGYTNITEPWRNKGFNSASFSGFPKDDTQLLNKWWRFTGIGGDRVADGCVPLNHGGTWRTIKIPLPYPTTDSVTPTTVNAYGYHFVCGGITFPVSIALCPGGFYVYKPNGHPLNPMGYVTYHYECKPESCGPLAKCTSDGGCICDNGYEIPPKHLPTPDSFGCVDIDECQRTAGICGPNSNCSNTPGTYMCICWNGFSAADPTLPPGEPNQCEDTDECLDNICGAHGTCLNNIGSYVCNCNEGFHIVSDAIPVCQDVDECSETPGICGNLTVCTNVPGTFYCSCPDGFFPSTGVIWEMGISFCKSYEDILGEIKPRKGQTKERAFLENMEAYLKNNTGVYLPEVTVANIFAVSMEMSGVGQGAKTSKVSSDGDGKIGSLILDLSEHLVVAMTPPTENQTKKEVHTSTVDLSLLAIGARSHDNRSTSLSAKGHIMKINLKALARSNNGTASAAFMTLNGMESLLSHRYFKTKNRTEMYSDVFTAIIPAINTTNLMEPVNFTIQHRKEVPETGMITCVYWEDDGEKTEGRQGGETMRWSEEGCWVTYSHENYTICSCSHLSTFALILQIGEPSPQDDFLEWLNRICVIVGLFFFGLAILTFLLCSWNPKINNTARLHLCLNLALSHLLLLWNDKYTEHKLACTIMAGLLHFLIVSGFVWMLLEAVQLHLLVLRLSKVKIIQRDGLPRPLLYLIGYGVPFVIVGVSALIYSDGYGATEANVCWLSQKRNFKWALTGPVITVLAINGILFSATLWNLRPTLTNIKSDISQSKDTKLILFKILAQFVILGCTWILGLYQTNVFFQVIFIIFNSQQGTFLYIVHCVLNKEVREEYMKWLTCSFNKTREGGSVKDVPSISEDLDNPREQTD